MSKAEISYCGQIVKEQDPDRFLLSMFMPAQHREALWALFAFNYEIAKTREVVSETQLGLIRLQWWKDSIAKSYTNEDLAFNETILALDTAIKKYDLAREDFEMLIHAREFDLEDVLPGNLEGLINYADFTTTPLMKMAVQILGGDPALEPVQAISVNYALSGLLRSVLFHAKQRRCYLPQDLLRMHDVKVNQLYELKPQEGVVDVVRAVRGEIVGDMHCENKFLKLSQKLALMYADQLQACGYDVFSSKAQIQPSFKVLRLFMRALTR